MFIKKMGLFLFIFLALTGIVGLNVKNEAPAPQPRVVYVTVERVVRVEVPVERLTYNGLVSAAYIYRLPGCALPSYPHHNKPQPKLMIAEVNVEEVNVEEAVTEETAEEILTPPQVWTTQEPVVEEETSEEETVTEETVEEETVTEETVEEETVTEETVEEETSVEVVVVAAGNPGNLKDVGNAGEFPNGDKDKFVETSAVDGNGEKGASNGAGNTKNDDNPGQSKK